MARRNARSFVRNSQSMYISHTGEGMLPSPQREEE